MTEPTSTRFPQLPPLAIALIAIGLLLAIGLSGWWLLRPEKAVLFRDLDERAIRQVTAALQLEGIPYEYSETSGALLVPESRLLATRMELASRGLPEGGSVGFELFSETNYGMTEFAQKVNFQRALQGELERTINALETVRSTRVHLTLPNESVFLRDTRKPKASVTILPVDNARLQPTQIAGIQHLVAAAVERLEPESVIVLDQHGNPLASADGALAANGQGNRIDSERAVEQDLENRLTEMLTGILGETGFTVSVDASFDYSRIHQTNERIVPQGLNGESLVQRRRDAGNSSDENAASSHQSMEVEYVHGRTVEEVELAPGRLERLMVGISIARSLPAETETRLRELVAAAAGLVPERGDRIVVSGFPGLAAGNSDAEPALSEQPVTSPEVPQAAASKMSTSVQLPQWLISLNDLPAYLLGAAGALLLLLLALPVFLAYRSGRPARLSHDERVRTLQEIDQWLKSDARIDRKAA